jgi:hypothetical protein
MQIPGTRAGLCRFLAIPDALSHRVWSGLRRATWSQAVALRQSFLLHEPVRGEVDGVAVAVLPFAITGLTSHVASPAKLIATLEACVQEGVVTRKAASQFQEYVLQGMAYEPSDGGDAHPDRSRWLTRGERVARTAAAEPGR